MRTYPYILLWAIASYAMPTAPVSSLAGLNTAVGDLNMLLHTRDLIDGQEPSPSHHSTSGNDAVSSQKRERVHTGGCEDNGAPISQSAEKREHRRLLRLAKTAEARRKALMHVGEDDESQLRAKAALEIANLRKDEQSVVLQ